MQLLSEDDIILQGLIKGLPIKKTSHPLFPSLLLSLAPSISPPLSSLICFSLFCLSLLSYMIHPFPATLYISTALPCSSGLLLVWHFIVLMNVFTDVTIIHNKITKKIHIVYESFNTSQINQS